jgi:hypothetical protein
VLPLVISASASCDKTPYVHGSECENPHDHDLGLSVHLQVPNNENGQCPKRPVGKRVDGTERISDANGWELWNALVRGWVIVPKLRHCERLEGIAQKKS